MKKKQAKKPPMVNDIPLSNWLIDFRCWWGDWGFTFTGSQWEDGTVVVHIMDTKTNRQQDVAIGHAIYTHARFDAVTLEVTDAIKSLTKTSRAARETMRMRGGEA